MSVDRTAVVRFVNQWMEDNLPAKYTARVWRAVRRDALDAAANRWGCTVSWVRIVVGSE